MLRERCAKYMSEFPVLGYHIDGLFTDEIPAHEVPIDSVMKIISHTLVRLNHFDLNTFFFANFNLLIFSEFSSRRTLADRSRILGS